MAKLCPECQKKTFDLTLRGTCQAPTLVPAGTTLPGGHFPWTNSPNFSLCDACADHFDRCAACWGSLDGGGSGVVVPTTKQFVRAFDKDNGIHITGTNVGEQVLVQLAVQLFSGLSWGPTNNISRKSVSYAHSRIVPAGGYNFWLELYFDLNAADQNAVIELQEVSTRFWAVASSSKRYRITVEINQ